MPKIIFEGTVFGGKGEGKQFITLPWVTEQIKQKVEFIPYPGTLNVRLKQKSIENKSLLETKKGIRIEPQKGYCLGIMFRASIEDVECAVILPQVPSYPSDVLEVIAPVYLRGQLKLLDGSEVSVLVII
ncbi:MAG: CTP-dependent riboflavin kinase [Candidatus Bathyarchaeota archaeon]|nr:CTP-dependent riboflavin kinase [Candidatus Bathyarchaeota archaeon]